MFTLAFVSCVYSSFELDIKEVALYGKKIWTPVQISNFQTSAEETKKWLLTHA